MGTVFGILVFLFIIQLIISVIVFVMMIISVDDVKSVLVLFTSDEIEHMIRKYLLMLLLPTAYFVMFFIWKFCVSKKEIGNSLNTEHYDEITLQDMSN